MRFGRIGLQEREMIMVGSCENEWMTGRVEQEQEILRKESTDRDLG